MFSKFKTKRKDISLRIHEDRCTGCGNCVIVCKRNVFSLMYEEDKLRTVVSSPESCKGCRRCLDYCKKGAIEITIK